MTQPNCLETELPVRPVQQRKWRKDTSPFTVHETNLETQPGDLTGVITPNDRFFVCSQTRTPDIDLSTYSVRVEGDGVRRSLQLKYDDVLALPSRTLGVYLECAGNHRALFERVMGEQVDGDHWTRWMLGGVGMAQWTGVSLRTVLEMAGVRPEAVDVNVQGLDTDAPEGGTNRPMPIEKAMDPDTLLVYGMNGEVLPPDHGFPLRVIVPGWIGSNSIKWVGKITVSTSKIWVHRNRDIYVLKGRDWSTESHRPAQGGAITTLKVQSSLALSWETTLNAGRQTLRGIARSPHAPIARVEWSSDGGASWREARLRGPAVKYSLAPFELEWDAPLGRQGLRTRATDTAGNTQPEFVPFNRDGYLFNQVYDHPVTVVPGMVRGEAASFACAEGQSIAAAGSVTP